MAFVQRMVFVTEVVNAVLEFQLLLKILVTEDALQVHALFKTV